MSYFRKSLGAFETSPCTQDPTSEVCQALHPPAPEPGSVFTGFADMIKQGVAALTPAAPAATTAAAAAGKPTAQKSTILPIVLVGGGAVALWMLLRKKKP